MKNFIKKSTAIFIIIALVVINLFVFSKPVNAASGVTLTMVDLSSDGILTVTGESLYEEFESILIDGGGFEKEFYSDISGEKSFTYKLDTKQFDIGYHTLSVKLYSGEIINFPNAFPTFIYDNNLTIKKNTNFLYTGSNYVVFTPDFWVNDDNGISLGVQIGKGDEWGDVYGNFKSYVGQKITKLNSNTNLKPDTEYKIRIFYYKNTTYGGKTYTFKSDFSNVVTFKTGKEKAPSIKSISAKCISQKKHAIGNSAYWDANGVFHPAYHAKIWQTKYKVTVKLKKKPGTKGIYIGGKKVKGNKKTYTVTFTDSGKLKGKKLKIGVLSYNDNEIGAYSPSVAKSVKIK